MDLLGKNEQQHHSEDAARASKQNARHMDETLLPKRWEVSIRFGQRTLGGLHLPLSLLSRSAAFPVRSDARSRAGRAMLPGALGSSARGLQSAAASEHGNALEFLRRRANRSCSGFGSPRSGTAKVAAEDQRLSLWTVEGIHRPEAHTPSPEPKSVLAWSRPAQ